MPTSANFLGSPEPGQGSVILQLAKGTSAGITKGDLCTLTSDKWVIAPAAATAGPYAVALETAATATTTIKLLLKGIVYVTADGTIAPNAPVKNATATAGQVIAATVPTDSYSHIVGIYLGHENEGDGKTIPTSAADGDVIRILVGGAP
jgi:hypothetical protein